MQLTDGTQIFDTDIIDEAAKKRERDEQEREMLNAFARYAYLRYKQIRDKVNPRKCKYMYIHQVRQQLALPARLQRVCKLLTMTEEEVLYIVEFVRKYLKYVK
ncbi:hypothetical protein JIN86_21230 [Lysinibacillus sp. HST-98]|uniref:Uncharacterized protein n=2 Tax=Lysinibacillus TaxID=400634 RepID=A0A2X0YEY8_9BACI|nr:MULTISPECIES: hypothetical protein [Lysinibacillus]EFI68532.1 hypothetical protein BFZC1_10712 [Lysinibacillus fusiformis ZC1]EKU43666.1 hypothetical protein C518_1548 [Lysinibacillus fusiformis ZB2]KMN39030.1 hypothetical protein VK91_14830 [Lysinibacillus sp. LK3]MBL3732091.1 hypothetical protein [Lysinibacillus sp. HST-98]MBU5254124.1 hypothetical protein [Lysinibacillus capsici]